MKHIAHAALVAVLVSVMSGSGFAQDLTQCLREEPLKFRNTCQVPIRVFYKLRAEIADPAKINEWMQLAPGQEGDLNYFSVDEVTKGGGIVRVVCAAGQDALEADGRCPWRGRSASPRCGPHLDARPLCN